MTPRDNWNCSHACGLVNGFCCDCQTQVYKPIPQAILRQEPEHISPLPADDAARKALPILTFLCEYFPDVVVALTQLCVQGNVQHNAHLDPTDIKWARGKSKDQLNTAFRHIFERKLGIKRDSDGQLHAVKGAWRCMAQAQLDIEEERGVAVAPVMHHPV
jgi:hypothetical protein